ncbi:hypothetical protein OV090_40060 [Nannocystis sp. RBIL2]|uniref:hypothetical protein n=1 Tax=Nannocystis sp. RBIL2 TaxID=2996788 RepID=UPI00226D4FB9|nr:hypothetical protein [Nannocystis sp. RBIL2]MCY1071005.1 hypothetical protein [Nannocystis sp. RBIL2]
MIIAPSSCPFVRPGDLSRSSVFRRKGSKFGVVLAALLSQTHGLGCAGQASTPRVPTEPTSPSGSAASSTAQPASAIALVPPGLTGAALFGAVDLVMKSLRNVIATGFGDAGITAGQLATQLGITTEQLRRLLHDELNVPLTRLGLDVQEVARRLLSVTERASNLLSTQQRCAFQNIESFSAGLQTMLLELRTGVPFVKPGRPRLDYLKFDGHSPSVVPPSGGRATLHGFRLWDRSAPTVELYDDNRQSRLKVLQAQAGGSANSVSVVFDVALISENAGRCLQLRVRPRDRRGKVVSDLFIPMCVPPAFSTRLALTGSISYACPQAETRRLEQRIFYFENTSCEDRKPVSLTERWPLPDGCSIIRLEDRPGALNRHQSNVSLSFNADSVTAAGWLDTAECAWIKLLSHTMWQRLVTPVVHCKIEVPQTASITSLAVRMEIPTTQICVNVPKRCASPTSVFWFDLSRSHSDGQATGIFTSPRVTSNNNGASTTDATVGELQISSVYNPNLVDGTAQICAMTKVASCDY